MESQLPNEFKIGRQSDESQGNTTTEGRPINPCDGVRYFDPHQGITTPESIALDDSNGRMEDDFRDISRDILTIEAPISVHGGCEVWNGICWQVCTEVETKIPTSIFINPRDCEDSSVDRESELIPPPPGVNDPWVQYHVGMWKLYIYTVVAKTASNKEDSHGWLSMQRLAGN